MTPEQKLTPPWKFKERWPDWEPRKRRLSRGEIESRRLVAEYESLKPAPILEPEEVEVIEKLAEGTIECEVVDIETDPRYRTPIKKVRNAGSEGAKANGTSEAVIVKSKPVRGCRGNKQHVITLFRLGIIDFRKTLNASGPTSYRFYLPEFAPHNKTLSEQLAESLLQLCFQNGEIGFHGREWCDKSRRCKDEARQLLEAGEIIRVESNSNGPKKKVTYYHRDFAPTTAKENEA